MAMLAPAAELILDGIEGGSIIQGAETVATEFKNELLKGIPFGVSEALAFTGATSAYNHIKDDLGFSNNNQIKKGRHKKRCSM